MAESGADDELVSLLTVCEGAARRLDRVTVDTVAALERRGTFSERGYKSTAGALRDLLGWERFEARRRVTVAEHVTARVGLDGGALPARLPQTAAAFERRSGEPATRRCRGPRAGDTAAARLTPEQWAGAEEQIAAKTTDYTPSELHAWGTALVEALDQDGAEPDDRPPPQVNELFLTRTATGGGKLKGRFDDAAMFDAIAAVIDAKAKPLTGDDDRSAGERQAEALADVCGYMLDHGDVPDCGGHRPHVNVLVRLEDLENRARAAALDFGGRLSPESLRMLCCDAAVVPIVFDGAGQPLDVGRATRTIPDGLRRAVAARDRGCAHPAATGRRRGASATTSCRGSAAARRSCPIWPCCAGSTTGRSIARSGSAASATGCRSSYRRRGSTRSGGPGEKRCRILPEQISHRRGDGGIRTGPRRRTSSAPGRCALSSSRADPWPPPRRSARG